MNENLIYQEQLGLNLKSTKSIKKRIYVGKMNNSYGVKFNNDLLFRRCFLLSRR